MKKIISQISFILLIMMIGLIFVLAQENVYAASVIQVSSHKANVGEQVTVTITLPDGTTGYNGTINFDNSKLEHISNSNGGGVNGGTISVADANTNLGQVSNITVTFKVIAEGEAIVSATLNCSNSSNVIIYNGTNAGTINKTETPATPPETPTANFSSVNETVYTTERCNVRESYSTSSKKIDTISAGKELKRTGVGDNGWSKVEYNGKEAYISSQYLTTTKPADPKFTDSDETMYATQDCNVRKSWDTSSEKVGYLNKAQEVKRTGVGENGWSRIDYNGTVAYVATRLLSTEKPEEVENEVDNNTVSNEVNNVVDNEVNNDTNNIVDDELGALQNEIGVIPEVGNNIAKNIYFIVLTLALITVLYMNYKSRDIDENK